MGTLAISTARPPIEDILEPQEASHAVGIPRERLHVSRGLSTSTRTAAIFLSCMSVEACPMVRCTAFDGSRLQPRVLKEFGSFGHSLPDREADVLRREAARAPVCALVNGPAASTSRSKALIGSCQAGH